jgi:hypothetical protein
MRNPYSLLVCRVVLGFTLLLGVIGLKPDALGQG